ncbi:MAG: hypothetical protein NTW72_14800 [Gemmatimonadetes bacterium]|nr:hypothetical protein [Gemmatimonadota bacterium]
MMRPTRFGAIAAAALLVASACTPLLDVKNNDAPDVLRALATPADVKSVAASSLNTWYVYATTVEPYLMFDVTADHATANYGNFGMRFNNEEPRIPYGNSSAGSDRAVAETPWNGQYGALGAANDALKAFKAGVKLATDAETDQYKTLAMFAQASALTELGLIFDKAFVVDENSVGLPVLVKYQDVITAAMTKWDAVIAASLGKTYEYPNSVFPLEKVRLSGSTLNRIANTFAARALAYSARTKAETDALSWAKILGYADKGISGNGGTPFDISIIGDGYVNWYADFPATINSIWGVPVDVSVINMMSPNVPAKFDGTKVAPGAVHDARLQATSAYDDDGNYISGSADFSYEGYVVGQVARGIWKQSPYFYGRYQYYGWNNSPGAEGPQPYTLAAENDLLIAEALCRTGGDLARAATLINKTRVTRGHLTAAAAGDGAAKLLTYIAYEQDIELFSTVNALYLRRRLDNLQIGTPRHIPVPAKELETLGLPIYTFGGVTQNPTGK